MAWLHSRHISVDDLCPWGCNLREDYDHLTSSCRIINECCGFLANWGFRLPRFSSFADLLAGLQKFPPHSVWLGKLWCSLIHRCWLARGFMKHQKPFETPMVIAAHSLASISLSWKLPILEQRGTIQSLGLSQCRWYPPPPGWIKLNLDGNISCNGCAGVGLVLRDHSGLLLKAAGTCFIHWDSHLVELLAFKFIGMVLEPWMVDVEGIVLEGDNCNVLNFIRSSFKDSSRLSSQDDIDLSALKQFKQVLFCSTGREANRAADLCANLALSYSNFCWSDCNAPSSLLDIIKEDGDLSGV